MNRTAMPLPAHPDVAIEADRRVWDGHFPLDEVRFRHRRFDGTMSAPRSWELWRRGRAAALLPYDPDEDALVLLEQFRLPALAASLDPVLVEVPAGLCDGDESADVTAVRETREEIGLEVDRLEPISSFLLTPGGSDEFATLFAGRVRAPAADASGLCGSGGLPRESEDIRVRVWSAARAIEAVFDNAFPNSVTVIALLWFASRHQWLRARWRRA